MGQGTKNVLGGKHGNLEDVRKHRGNVRNMRNRTRNQAMERYNANTNERLREEERRNVQRHKKNDKIKQNRGCHSKRRTKEDRSITTEEDRNRRNRNRSHERTGKDRKRYSKSRKKEQNRKKKKNIEKQQKQKEETEVCSLSIKN